MITQHRGTFYSNMWDFEFCRTEQQWVSTRNTPPLLFYFEHECEKYNTGWNGFSHHRPSVKLQVDECIYQIREQAMHQNFHLEGKAKRKAPSSVSYYIKYQFGVNFMDHMTHNPAGTACATAWSMPTLWSILDRERPTIYKWGRNVE